MPPTPAPAPTPTVYILPESVFVKLFDWPFLAFILLAIAIILFRQQLVSILGRGDILISWGENRSIQLRDLSESLDEELDPIRDQIDTLTKAVAALQSNAQSPNAPQVQSVAADDLSHEQREEAKGRMRQALSGKYLWRSVERLAILGRVTESQAIDILRSDNDVVVSMGKSGRQIARLASRLPASKSK